jgi:hypothetical protein
MSRFNASSFSTARNRVLLLLLQIEYGYLEIEAKERIPRDPDDWHTVKLWQYI